VNWIGALLVLVGTFIIRKKDARGWLFLTAGSMVLLLVVTYQGLYGMTVMEIVFVLLSIDSYFKWKKEEKTDE
jgi:nicotinamide riboside transporter PnuC